jgi:hypothetical protein
VGGRVLIQITPQMRILVAVESIDGRKYAPSIDMRSCAEPSHTDGRLRVLGRRITSVTL